MLISGHHLLGYFPPEANTFMYKRIMSQPKVDVDKLNAVKVVVS